MSTQTDRGPGTVDPDGPRSSRGLWRLSRLPGLSAVKVHRVAEAYPSWDALTDAEPSALARLGVAYVADRLRHVPEVELPRTVDGHVLSCFEDGYPAYLAAIPNAPLLLWVDGALPPAAGIAVVGTRTPTDFGIRVAQRAAREATALGEVVVSGMAAGVDQAAEAAAVAADGVVVSVLGAGLDQVPAALAGHRDAILACGGAVVAELPPGTPVSRPSLDARDRIQSGLSRTVVVAQTGFGGGTATTVRFALLHGRRLVVARPADGSPHAQAAESALSLALADPDGMDPALLGLSGRHAAVVANRRPVADVVVSTGEDLAAALRIR